MINEYARIQRGMVFWLDHKQAYGYSTMYTAPGGKVLQTHIQYGRRPYLVVSCNAGNNVSPTCTVVPITTADKRQIPPHVSITLPAAPTTSQTILTEQIMTVDIGALGEYMCTLTESAMLRVDRALCYQLGIQPPVICSDSTVEYVEKIVERIINQKVSEKKQEISDAVIEDTALRIGSALEVLFAKSEQDCDRLPADSSSKEKPKLKNTESKTKRSSAARQRVWTKELCQQYITEFAQYTLDEMAIRWGLGSADSARATLYNCKKRLKKFERQ